jgi:hypothetical protein
VSKKIALSLLMAAAFAAPLAHADVRITEVAAWGSGSSTGYSADWFELTNTGTSVVNISGWKMDDNSNSFALAVALTGITSIAAGESVIFLETSTLSTTKTSFLSAWFGNSAPTSLQIGAYSGSGVGLSGTADAVNIYNSGGTLQTNVSFGLSESASPFHSFNNAAGLNNALISLTSVAGTQGAFAAASSVIQIGSPGTIAAAVPEPETYAMLLAGLGLIGAIARQRSKRA